VFIATGFQISGFGRGIMVFIATGFQISDLRSQISEGDLEISDLRFQKGSAAFEI